MKKLIPDYLQTSRHRIRNLAPQPAFTWSDNYDRITHPRIEKLKRTFPSRAISRKGLVLLYAEWKDPVLALVATLVWGGIDTAKKQRLQAVLEVGSDELRIKLNAARALIRRGQYQAAFLACSRGGQHEIPGVGPSFFTKIFFFMGQADDSVEPKPLILDKWTTNALFALSCQTVGWRYLPMYFSIPSEAALRKYKHVPLKANPAIQASAYSFYVTLMNHWAESIGVAPDVLEQFVFGEDLRCDRGDANPRKELLAIIEEAVTSWPAK